MEIVQALQRLLQTVQTVNAEPRLQPGASPGKIMAVFGELGIDAPEPLRALYEWHDGIHYLNAFLHFLPLVDAASTYRSFKQLKDQFPAFGWHETLFPVLTANGNIDLCIDVASGAVVSIDVEDDQIKVVAQHYEPYVRALEDLFETHGYVFDSHSGKIKAKPDVWAPIAAKHGVEESWWARA